ncbi:MAG: RDD family protein [Nitrosopumilus sp. (ex Thoosa mismalolli)]|nr:RDD family protein [Nitrosopumilus sp. (ex Thoosa mismalolli)]
MTDSDLSSKIILARWTDRFLAWLIDFIIISITTSSIIFASMGTIDYDFEDEMFWAENSTYIPTSMVFFAYWTILEFKTGQTIGKKILNLRVTDLEGNNPTLKGILLSSFGKAFILPLDIIPGWILTNEHRQRVFNKLGDTIVIKMKNESTVSEFKYEKD